MTESLPKDPFGLAARRQDMAEAAALQSWLVGNARTVRPVEHSGLMAWALAALKANPALVELHLLEEVCAHYANDEDAFNREDGEPFGSIPTLVGMKARQARERFIEREERTNTSGQAHCPNCAVCHTSEETCVIALKRFNSLALVRDE
ncbi:hypothetical protein [Pseudomonas sp. UMAB-40]|uniref:hypothetical protein n=1 Tax=Pseudomonas sp. UMAB-40 TaxID=1365407 RepID=UPI001C574113|nr:hypothetical protein [Pseudomonas sp. UMAB-40]